MQSIGILGTGRMATRLARQFDEMDLQITLGSRNPERAIQIVKENHLKHVTPGRYEDAVKADWILPAIFLRDGLLDILEPFKGDFKDKLLIDISNPFNSDYTDFILPWNTSSAEEIQKRFPESKVVGAFKNVWWEVFDAPLFKGDLHSDVFVVSDHEDAKRDFLTRVTKLPFRFIDSGLLRNARTIERMTLLSGELGQRYGYFPRMNYRFLGELWTPGQAEAS